MPIKITDLRAAPINVSPDYTLPGVKYHNSYDKGYRKEMVQEWNRANNQTWYNQLGSGLISRGLSIGTKFGAGVGSVLGATSALFTKDITDIWDNPLTNAMNEADDALRNSLPVYKSQKYMQGDLLRKMGSTSFWFDDGFDGIAFLASAYGGGTIGKGIGSAARGVGKALGEVGSTIMKPLNAIDESLVSATKTFGGLEGGMPTAQLADEGLQALDDVLGKYIAKPTAQAALTIRKGVLSPFKAVRDGLKEIGLKAHQGDLLAATAYNTVSEAGAEAYQTSKEVEGLLKDLRRNNPDYQSLTDEDIKKRSAQAASETFWWNTAVLAVPNFIQNKMLHSSFNDRSSAIRKSIWDNKGETTAALKEIASRWGEVGKGLVSEGLWEENIQTAIQQYERVAGTNLKDNKNMAEEIGKNYANGLKGFVKSFLPGFSTDAMEDESAISIMLGGIIGGGMGARSTHMENKSVKSTINAEKTRYDKLFKEYGPAAESLFVDNVKSIYQQNGTKKVTIKNAQGEDVEADSPNFVIENGQLQKNPEAVTRLVTNQLRNKHLFDAQLLAAYKNDPLLDEYNKQVGLAAYAHDLISKEYTAEEVSKLADEATTIGTQEAKDLGVETFIQDNMSKVKEYAKTLEAIAASNASAQDLESEDGQEDAFKRFLNKTEYYTGVKKAALENIRTLTTNPKTLEAIDALLEDVNGVVEQLKTDKKGIREEYFNTVAPARNMHAEYNDLQKEKNKTSEQTERFNKLDYLVREEAAINGTWAAQDISHSNTYGATNKELVNTTPGTRSAHYYNLGRQALAVEQAKQNIAAGEDVLRTANSLMDNAYYADNDFKDTIDPLMSVLEDQKQEMQEAADGMEESMAQIAEFADGEITVGELDEATRDLLLEHEVLPVDNNGIADIDSYISEGVDADAFQSMLQTLVGDLNKTKDRLAKTSSVIQRYNDLDEQNSQVSEHLRKLLTDNSEDYLIQKYFQDNIANPIHTEISLFEQNPDNYFNLDRINEFITILQRAKAAFKDREGDFNGVRNEIDYLYDTLVNELRPKTIENRESRRSKQIELNNGVTVRLVQALGLGGNSKLSKLVKDVLGEENVETVLGLIEDDEVYSYDAALSLVLTLKEKASEEQLKEISEQLSEDLGGYLLRISNAFTSNIPDKRMHPPKNFLGSSSTLGGKSAYELNPQSTIVALMKRLFNKEIKEQRTIAYRYAFDHDLVSFNNNIDTELEFSAEQKQAFKEIYDLHTQAAEIAKTITLLDRSNADISAIIAAKKGLSGLAPTPQQSIILSDALSFIFNGVPTSQLDYEGWMLIKGIAGSGKSLLSKMLSTLITTIDPKAKGYAFSGNQFTSDNINTIVFGHNNNRNNIEQFLAMTDDQLNELSYVIIDEVFTLTDEKLEAVKTKLKNTKHDIKVIALGDPSQYTADETTAHKLMTNAALRSAQTFSMSVSYRTNVGAISSFISTYQMNPKEVTGSFVQANKSINEAAADMSNTVGVHGGNVDELVKLVNAPSSRSRVVLVSNALDRDELRKSIPPSIPILLFQDAQGYQWDEVYTYLDKGTMGNSIIQQNRGLYTAFSRAKQYLFITGLGASNVEPDPKLSNSIDENPEDLKLNAEDYTQALATASKAIQILTGAVPVAAPIVTPTPVVITEEDETFDAEVPTEDVIPIEDETGITADAPEVATIVEKPTNPNSYVVAHPTNYNVSTVKPGAPIHIVRAKDRKGKDYYYIVSPTGGNNFVVVGVLGNKDFTSDTHGKNFKELLDAKPSIFIPKDTIVQEGFTINNIDNVSLQTGTLDVYDGLGNKYDRDADGKLLYRQQNDLIEDSIKKFYNSFFGKDALGRRIIPEDMVQRDVDGEVIVNKQGAPVLDASKEWVINGKINWVVVKKHTRVIIFDRKNRPTPNTHVGIPYLEIIDPRQASIDKKNTKTSKSIFIPMQPKKFSKSSDHYSPIRKLYDTLSELSTIDPLLTLGSDTLVTLLEQVAKSNFTLKDVGGKFEHNPAKRFEVTKTSNTISSKAFVPKLSKENAAKADTLIEQVIPLIFAPDLKNVYKDTSDEAKAEIGKEYDGKLVTGSREQANGKHILQYKADPEGEDIRDLKVWTLRAGRGSAQRSLNILAQANQYLTDGSGLSIQLRMEQQAKAKRKEKLDEFKLTRARSILSTEPYVDYAEIYRIHPEWEVNVSMFKSREHLKNHLIKHGKTTSEEFENIIFNNTHHPITLGILELVVGDKYFDAQGNHNLNNFYLREPLDSRTPSKTGINDIGADLHSTANRTKLASLLRTAYQGTRQTKVSITLGKVDTKASEEFEPTTAAQVLTKLPAPRNKDAQNVLALLLSKGKNAPIVYDLLPHLNGEQGGATNGVDPILFNYDPVKKGTEAATYNVLHELLHYNLNLAIWNSEQDRATPQEEQFTIQIQALRNKVNQYAIDNGLDIKNYMVATPSVLDEKEFVANLSHPPFIDLLKKVKVGRTTVWDDLLKAILDLLGVTESTAYDVMFKSIENFLSPAVPTKSQSKEYTTLEKEFLELMPHIDTYSRKYYQSFFDFDKMEFLPDFKARPVEDRIQTLKDFKDFDAAKESGIDDDIYYGYYSEPGVFFSTNPGALVTNQSVMKLYEAVVERVTNEHTRNLIATILSKQIQDPIIKLLPNIIQYGSDTDTYNLFSLIINDVLTTTDRRMISEELDVPLYELTEAVQNSEKYAPIILEAVFSLVANRAEVENLVESSDLFSTRKYEVARNYVIQKIKENKETTQGLIKTKGELLDNILTELRSATNPSIALRAELDQKLSMVSALSSLIAGGNTSKIKELRNLLEVVVPSIEQRLAGLSALTSTNRRTGKLLFYDIVSDIYPKNKFSEDEDLEIFQNTLDDAENTRSSKEDSEVEDSTGINEHIKKYNKSYEITLSESIKDFLALVSVNNRLLNPSLVYIKTLQYITSLDVTTLDKVKAQVNDTLSDRGLSDVDRAIYTNLQELLSIATNNYNANTNTALPTSFSIVTNTTKQGITYYKGVYSTKNVINESETSAKIDPEIELSPEFYNSEKLYNWMKERSPLTTDEFNGLFIKAEAVNALRELHNVMASMKETELMVGTRTNKKGIEVAYIRSKAMGINTSAKESIKTALEDLHRQDKLQNLSAHFKLLDPVGQDAIFGTSGKSTIVAKKEGIKSFFDLLGLSSLTPGLTISDEEVVDLVETIQYISKKAKTITHYSTDAAFNSSELSEESDEALEDSIEFFIKDMDAKINLLSDVAAKSSIYLRNPSVRSASGEKFYKFHESSWGYDVMLNLIRMKGAKGYFKGTRGGNEYRKAPSFLQTNFYDHNIFKTGLSEVMFMGEHEALKNMDNDVITKYVRESKFHYFHREFIQGFLDGARQYNGNSFFLFNTTPSDKPKTPLFRVSLLSDKPDEHGDSEIKQGIRAALQQFIDKEGISLDVAYYNDSNKNDRFRNFTLAKEAEKIIQEPLSSTTLNKYVNTIHKLLEQEASKLADEMMEVELTFDVNTFRKSKINKLNRVEQNLKKSINEDTFNTNVEGWFTNYANTNGVRKYAVKKEMILPLVDLYVKNHYVNSFHLHQLFTGDYAAYKGSSSEIVKRMAGVYAPGIRGLVDPSIGMKEKFEVLVLKDTSISTATTEERLRKLVFGTLLSPTDKIIYGHPGIGKTYLKDKGANFISFDDDYQKEINDFVDSKREGLTRQEYKAQNKTEYSVFLGTLWSKAKALAKKENKQLFVSNLPILRNYQNDFDKVITLSTEEFLKRSTLRGETDIEYLKSWKQSIDEQITTIDKSKVISTDKYLEQMLGIPSESEESEFQDLMKLFGDYDVADAQGFMLPSRYGDMERGFGRGWGLGNVMKPVHFELIEKTVTRADGTTYSTAIPVYMKYSSIVLEDTLVSKFPALAKLREKLEHLGVDELVFHTGIKTGIPVVRDTEGNTVDDLTFENFMAMEDITPLRQYQTTPILSLSNSAFRLQHNPASDPRKNVSIFTQLMYFLNVYENTFEEAKEAYSLVGELIKIGREEFLDGINLRKFLQKKFSGPGAERALELMRAGVSLNNPLLEKKAIIALASGLESATVKIKFPGGKLVLQTPQGIAKYYDQELFKDVPKEAEELAYKTEVIDGVSITYAEVIVPSELLTPEMLKAVKNKATIFMYGDAMGFRIPSSELHSAVPLRIVGVYSGSGTNVVIGPKELIPIHGSDFDVDALNIIMRENYTSEDLTKVTYEQLAGFIESLTELQNLVSNLEAGMSQTDAAKIKEFRNLLLQKFELEEESDELLKKEMSPDFQKDLRENYKDQLKITPGLSIEQFAADNGLKHSNGIFRVVSELGSNIYILERSIKDFEKENKELITKHKQIRTALNKQKDIIKKSKETKQKGSLALIDTPIGYKKENGLYVINEEFLPALNDEIDELSSLVSEAGILSSTIGRQVNEELKRKKTLKVKFIKNSVTEVMLRTISDKKNLNRMISPITFGPLNNAKDTVPKDLLPTRLLDLSNPRGKYKSYQSLADGAILTGAFANAVKVFGYLSRSGGEDTELQSLYADLKDYTLRIKHFGKFPEDSTLKELVNLKNTTSKNIKSRISKLDNQELRPYINNLYEFSLSINGTEHSFNRLTTQDVNGKYAVTTIFDSLLNAAIDNLKLGLLPEIRVNTRTGSSVVGMVSLGVPIDNIVQLLYSPILAPLASGTVDKLDKWSKGIEEKYEKELAGIRNSEEVLTDSQILNAVKEQKELADMNERELQVQLMVYNLFMKANKVGEDVRNLAKFLDIVRKMEVFIEDIDGVYADFHNKIGRIDIDGEDILLTPKENFSLIIPNMFRNNPHIQEAYLTHNSLIDTINNTFELHSKEVRSFVDSIPFSSLQNDEEVEDAVSNSAKARSSVASMLLSNIVWDDVAQEPNKVVSLGPNKNLILSKGRSFSERVASQLKEVQQYVREHKDEFKTPNRFLDLTVISKNPLTNTLGIRLTGGVNLNSIDIQDIARGFRMLNQFTFDKGTLLRLPANQGISSLQRDLLTYAVINYGLQFSTSNFSNVIDTRLIKELDEQFNEELTSFKDDIADNPTPWKDFFFLTYHMMNANRLGFVDFNRVEVQSTLEDKDGKIVSRNFVGRDNANIDGHPRTVYFDRKVRKATKKGEKPNPAMYSVEFKNKTEVFMKVESSDTHDYYQKVGKVSEAFYTKLKNSSHYSIQKYFSPYTPTIDFTMVVDKLTDVPGETMKILSSTNAEYLKEGDHFWIVPAYNFDRQESQLVTLVSKSEKIDKKYRSYQYEVSINGRYDYVAPEPEEFPEIEEEVSVPLIGRKFTWARRNSDGYEVSSRGDGRFSALNATLKDGRTIEEAYQLDVKGYRAKGNDWMLGKGKPPLTKMSMEESWQAYKALWQQWADENPKLVEQLAVAVGNKSVLTDQFAATTINQARALSEILSDRYQSVNYGLATTPDLSYAYYADDFVEDNRDKLKSTEDRMGYTLGGAVLDSVTGVVIPGMKKREYAQSDLTIGEKKANKIWSNLDEATRFDTNMGENLNKAEYIDKTNESYNKGIAKGTIFHKIIHYYFNRDEATGKDIQDLIQENGFTPGEFDWVFENIGGIIYKTGSDAFQRTFVDGKVAYQPSVNALDKIYTEVPLYSTELGMAGTADLLVDHSDDLYSMFDMKTGASFNRLFEFDMFKYGSTSTEDIFDTPRNRAKLQLMLYALMLKIQRPDAKFRNIELLHIKNRFSIYDTDFRRSINYGAYLEMIEKYLKNVKPDAYAKLQALPHFSSIFNSSTYGVVTKEVLDKPDIMPSIDLKLKTLRLQQLIMQRRNLEQDLGKGDPEAGKLLKEIESLMNKIIELRKAPGMDMAAWDGDISWMDRWMGSASSSTNPYVQLYYKQLAEAKDEAESSIQEWKREYDAKLKPVVTEYYTKNGLSVTEALGKMTKNYLGGINKQKLFDPLYKKETREGETVVSRLLTSKDIGFSNLSVPQQNFLNFVNDSVAQFFVNSKSSYIDPRTGKQVAIANKIATTRTLKGEEVDLSNLDLYNGKGHVLKSDQFKYYDGFLPKLYPTIDDVTSKHGAYSKEMLKFLKLKYTTNFYESMYDGWFATDEAMPMKYLDNKEIQDNSNFSTDLDHVMNNFVRQYTYKQHLDEVYAYGVGTKLYLHAKGEKDSNINYEKLTDWFEDSINLHVLGFKQNELNMRKREWRINTKNGFKTFNWPKFLRSVKAFFGASTMWLKPVSGTANFIFASLYTIKEGVRNSLTNAMYGTDKDNQDFGITDIAKGFGAAIKMLVGDAITGDIHKNKLYLLMEKYRYFNDSYDWYTNPNKLVTAKNKLFSTKSMYFFHSFPEEVISAAVFYAQMSSMKTADGKSMLDHYEAKPITNESGEVSYGLVWDGYVRGQRNTSNIDGVIQMKDVTELEPEESIAIKNLYERIHGGYKGDERVAAEYYVFGELMLQFKKYLPSVIKNGFASKGIRQQQGAFKANDKGELVWNPSVIEGRFTTLFNVLMTTIAGSNKAGGNKLMQSIRAQSSESYAWEELSREQKDNILDAAVTMFFFALMMFGYTSMWDRDDEDASKKVYGRIMNDFAGQWYLPELAKNSINLYKPIVADKSIKLIQASTQFTASVMLDAAGYNSQAITKQGNYRGQKEMERLIPFLSSWHDAIKFAKESKNSDILEIRLK